MAKKADAWKEYREAAVVDMVLETMPKVYYYTRFFFFFDTSLFMFVINTCTFVLRSHRLTPHVHV